MSERWMHRPRTVNVWEARSALRWGSQHEGYFKTETAAREFAATKIAAAGDVGRITNVTYAAPGGVVYYDEFEEMS